MDVSPLSSPPTVRRQSPRKAVQQQQSPQKAASNPVVSRSDVNVTTAPLTSSNNSSSAQSAIKLNPGIFILSQMHVY